MKLGRRRLSYVCHIRSAKYDRSWAGTKTLPVGAQAMKRDVTIGSTEMLTPTRFTTALSALDAAPAPAPRPRDPL